MSDSLPPDLDGVADWLSAAGHQFAALQPLAGDVSARRYVRALAPSGTSSVVAVYPDGAVEAGERFVRTTALLSEAGIRVPELYFWDPQAGMMLIEDAGGRTAYEEIGRGWEVLEFWQRALEVERRLRELPAASVSAINGALEGPILRRELQQSWDLVLEPRRLVGGEDLAGEFRLALFALTDALHESPRTPCHRDLMARNFIVGADGELVLIDHQDLRLGPVWYDLGSLLNDSVYASPEQESRLLVQARVDRGDYVGYHRAAAQRALKIVGTFTEFASRGSKRYVELIPPTLAAAQRHLERVPETAPLMTDLAAPWRREIDLRGSRRTGAPDEPQEGEDC